MGGGGGVLKGFNAFRELRQAMHCKRISKSGECRLKGGCLEEDQTEGRLRDGGTRSGQPGCVLSNDGEM